MTMKKIYSSHSSFLMKLSNRIKEAKNRRVQSAENNIDVD